MLGITGMLIQIRNPKSEILRDFARGKLCRFDAVDVHGARGSCRKKRYTGKWNPGISIRINTYIPKNQTA